MFVSEKNLSSRENVFQPFGSLKRKWVFVQQMRPHLQPPNLAEAAQTKTKCPQKAILN